MPENHPETNPQTNTQVSPQLQPNPLLLPAPNPPIPPGTRIIFHEEVVTFSQLPQGVKFYLNAKGRLTVHIQQSNRRLPAEHPAVKAYVKVLLRKGKGRKLIKGEFEDYWDRCLATALETPLSQEDEIWEDTLVVAVEEFMYVHYQSHDGGPKYTGTLYRLRDQLEEIAKRHQGWDHSDWDAGSAFHNYLEERSPLLERINIKLSFPDRTKNFRGVTLEYIDPQKIPPPRNNTY
jgi:hypothetical protein